MSLRQKTFRPGFPVLFAVLAMAAAVWNGGPDCRGQDNNPRIIVRPPLMQSDPVGRLIVEPNVEVGTQYPQMHVPPHFSPQDNPESLGGPMPKGSQPLLLAPVSQPPVPDGYEQPPVEQIIPGTTEPLFEQIITESPEGEYYQEECDDCSDCHPLWRLITFRLYKTSLDPGIGRERVMFAPMELDTTEPLTSISIRYNSYWGMKTPDRGEYFWANPNASKLRPERQVDYQEVMLRMENGGDRFSMITEIPLRILDPVVNDNTTGLSDISFGPKMVLVKGKRWQISHIFRTILKTGAVTRGLSAGHTSLEPAILARYMWTPDTFFHGELKWRFPVGADPDFGGSVLRYGFGASSILYETDTFAAMPTLEFVGWVALDGQKTRPDGLIKDVDSEQFFSIHPGMRFVLGPKGDLGLFELGIGSGFMLANNGYFEQSLRIDLRFSY